jgi:hypothetical protein
MKLKNPFTVLLLSIGFGFLMLLTGMGNAQHLGASTTRQVPIVYGTDLFHPHDDPDDHLDLATLFAMREFDIRAILLDLGLRQQKKPGRVPVQQMLALTGRKVPYGIGLAERLKSADDKGLDQGDEFQGAVNLLLKVLRETDRPIRILLTGSVRDLVAAYNREPALLKQKVESVHVNIGNSEIGGTEWNVNLDPQAYRGLMTSGLPIVWYPCLPATDEWSAHWRLERYSEVFGGAPLALQNFFLYMLHQVDTSEIDPIAALTMDLRPFRKLFWNKPKGMWCAASFIAIAGRKVFRVEQDVEMGGEGHYYWVAVSDSYWGGKEQEVFSFVPAYVELDENGKTAKLEQNADNANVKIIHVPDPELYAKVMTSCLRNMFDGFVSHWPVQLAESK